MDSWRTHSSTVRQFIRDISTTQWTELRTQRTGGRRDGHRKHHEMDVGAISTEAQNRITAQQLDEVVSELFRFRIGAKSRLWGFTVDTTFYVLWWDPEHEIYPTEVR